MKKYCIILLIILTLNGCQTNNINKSTSDVINQKVDSLLNIMTLDEKIGQMNQYNGFWDVTGPSPKNGDAKYKYENLKVLQIDLILPHDNQTKNCENMLLLQVFVDLRARHPRL